MPGIRLEKNKYTSAQKRAGNYRPGFFYGLILHNDFLKMNPEIKLIENYLSKHPLFEGDLPHSDPSCQWMVVVPVYREQDFIFSMFESLLKCDAPSFSGELILVFNCSDADSDEVRIIQKNTAQEIRERFGSQPLHWLKVVIVEAYDLPRKHFGAGWARKIGMDLATHRFLALNRPEGVILTLDADCLVDKNYFTAIEEWFSHSQHQGAAIYFEHPTEGEAFPQEVYTGITKYELHLRYYLQAHRYAGFPYAFHTMGSAMAVRAIAYARIGGMPRRQAGEDFYFLQKLIPLGGFGEISTTAVFPSPRPSDRVIFGTGAAIAGHLEGTNQAETTYQLISFQDLKVFFDLYKDLFTTDTADYESWTYNLSGPMRSFLLNSGFFDDLDKLKADCSRQSVFDKRFFEIFNAFKVVKYLNYVEEHFYDRMPVFDAAQQLLEVLGVDTDDFFTESELLEYYRSMEKKNPRVLL